MQLFSILVITFFLVRDGRRLLEFLYRQVPPERAQRLRTIADDVSDAIAGYVFGNFVISILAGLVTYVTLTILDVPFALPLAILFGFFDLIPLVGATLGGILVGIVVAFVDFPVGLVVWAAVLILYQQVENNLIQPLVYGRAVQLHPLIVIVAILIGAALLGVLGALVAIPAAAAVQAVVRDYWRFRQDDRGAAGRPRPRRGRLSAAERGSAAQLDPSSEEDTPPTPIIPGPAWAPSTGPTSDTNAGSEPKMSRHSSTRCRAVSWSWMCWTTHASAPSTCRRGRIDQPLEGAPSRAHALDRGDLLPEGQDRLDPERRAQPCLSGADPAPLAQVLERVEREPHLESVAATLGGRQRLRAAGSSTGGVRRREHHQPLTAGCGATVVDMDALPSLALVQQPLARLRRRLAGSRDPGREVDRDDLPPLGQKRLVDGGEVAHRRLGGGRPLIARAQALVEARVFGRGDLDLGPLLAIERDVEADALDPVLGDQLVRQVGGRVGDHGRGRVGRHRPLLSRPPDVLHALLRHRLLREPRGLEGVVMREKKDLAPRDLAVHDPEDKPAPDLGFYDLGEPPSELRPPPR